MVSTKRVGGDECLGDAGDKWEAPAKHAHEVEYLDDIGHGAEQAEQWCHGGGDWMMPR